MKEITPLYKTLLFVLFSFLLVQNALAQKTVKIKGTVTDENGNAMELVIVRVEKQSAFDMTNLKGHYSFTCQSTDSVVVVFSMTGYQIRKRVLRNPSDSVVLNVKLPAMGIELGEAAVKGLRKQTGTTTSIKPDATKFMPSTTGNGVEELISTQVGVSTHNELSSQYNVRGGSFDENSVYLNGVELYRPMLVSSGQQEGLSVINSDMVENIDFSAGGFEAKYGEKMSSVLDITYKKPKKFEASVGASLLGANIYVGFGNKKFSMMNSLRYKTTSYLLGSLETKGEYNPKFLDYQNYTSWSPNERWTLDFIGNVNDNNYNFMPSSRETKFGTMNDSKSFKVYFDGQEKDYFRTYFGNIGITRHFGKTTDLSLLVSAYSTREQETYDIQGEYWLSEATSQDELGVGTYREFARNYLTSNVQQYSLRFKKKQTAHTIQAGLTFKNERVKENATEWEMRDSSGYSLPNLSDQLKLYYSMRSRNEMKSNRIEAYLQDTYRWHNTSGLFTLHYGLRFAHWSWNSESLLSPRASIGFIPTKAEDWTFRFATGWYYGAPYYKELRDTVTQNGNTTINLNKNIKSQRSIHFVLGADYHFRLLNRPFRFTSELYYKALSDLNPYNVNNVRISYYGQNIASGYATGIDFKLFGEFVPGTDSWITLSLMNTKEKINGISIPRPTDQKYNLSLFFTDYFPGTDRWRLTLKGAFSGGLPFGAPHTGREAQVFRAPAYKRVDIGLSYRLLNNEDKTHTHGISQYFKNAWLGIDAFNVLGLENVSSYYWVTDVTNQQYAVPNYLTGRQINVRFLLEF
ncbi:MAG: carboxypeptidase-like regulatory domain-containing protein [Bacteroidaceae bacterium]